MSEVIRAFDRSANTYDDWYQTEKGKHVFKAELSLIEGIIPDHGIGLEMGAGTGIFANALTKDDRLVLCLDPSREMLTRAKNRGMQCILGSAESMPCRPTCFDFIYMIIVLEFLSKPVRAIGEASEAVREDASIFTLFVNSHGQWGKFYREMAEKGDPIFRHAKFYSLEEVNEMANVAGLTSVKALGTLTTGPTEPEPGNDVVEPSPRAGVIMVEMKKA